MSISVANRGPESDEFNLILDRIESWPPGRRIALARRILETLKSSGPMARAASEPPRGLSAREVQSLFKTDHPAPDDETVERWVDEYRSEKYGR